MKLTCQLAIKNCFIRGSVVRYVKVASRNVDTTLLEDATRRGMSNPFK
jgi:U6 snRNA-associated Sm-like protein LSm2